MVAKQLAKQQETKSFVATFGWKSFTKSNREAETKEHSTTFAEALVAFAKCCLHEAQFPPSAMNETGPADTAKSSGSINE